MERRLNTLTGSTQATLIDQDIAHIGRVMRPSLQGDLGGPILPATYWRTRLYQLLDSGSLSHAQLCAVDSLLLQLDRFETEPQPAWNELAPAAAALSQPLHPVAVGHPV
ncbi:hypothetical protein R69927_03009 [Paraburkholderia domus]|jgi:hypothetical protein|uniref:Uncharacterized protein n=1 Tax=Paraburkholderia domus TaxID=2793075 RepID=A0A9N8MYF3_9BURK|nr:hypothetical protein [Paraburkholderia domus]MBK5049661.1 hypothetical protein [Burkholderia sp. R-70006]MBK5087573.1 hypothetical protein [Burkholderia sp. R-69927]MBK5121723.1 hypothetical protein [Burkholderia sp. R-69980]MBK5167299.1 hypothetical protein [Burkholderia sp. R-70211]MBK5181000.1 hypothetical protein [Burkholderia sp. R-69749]MCI0145859.1 hypothetical protein [Paraburkholderia sediminicola]